MFHFTAFFFYLTIYPSTTLGTGVCAFKIAIFTLDHRKFEKKAVNCNLIGPDAGAGIILLSVRGGWVLGGRILCRGGGPVGYVWDEDEHVELINVILNV